MGCRNLSRCKTSAERKSSKKKEVMLATVESYQARCRHELQKHHNDLKDDPERLTTEFLVKICKCNCRLIRDDEDEPR
jgi:hypothetical protein